MPLPGAAKMSRVRTAKDPCWCASLPEIITAIVGKHLQNTCNFGGDVVVQDIVKFEWHEGGVCVGLSRGEMGIGSGKLE